MERFRHTETPAQEMHREMARYWDIQRELFNVDKPAKPPRIVTYEVGVKEADWKKIKRGIEIHPTTWPLNRYFIKAYLESQF